MTANCLHPGFVATRFADESGGLISRLAWLAKFFAISPAEGAQTIIYLASSPEVANVTGQYFEVVRPRWSKGGVERPRRLGIVGAQCGSGRYGLKRSKAALAAALARHPIQSGAVEVTRVALKAQSAFTHWPERWAAAPVHARRTCVADLNFIIPSRVQ